MKSIKCHIPTEQFGFLEIEFDSMEDLKENYSTVYTTIKLLQKKAVIELNAKLTSIE